MKKRTFMVASVLILAASAMAQIHGTPAGATSLGGGHTFANPVGVPAGATSLGPRGFAPQSRGMFFELPVGPVHRDGFRAHRVIVRPVPLYSYGVYPLLYPYAYSSYPTSSDMAPADYVSPDPAIANMTQPQIVVAPVQQPPQIIVIDNRGVHDASAEERQQALATTKAAKKPKQEEPRVETPPEPEDVGPMTVLVFRDGTRREVKNYAIMGKELIVLGSGSLRRIQIAELNVPATVQENDVRG